MNAEAALAYGLIDQVQEPRVKGAKD